MILRLARGTGTNVRLCVVAWVGSILLTFICIWKSTNESFDSSLRLLLSMGEIFQVISAFWMAKTVRDSLVPGAVTQSTWYLAVAGGSSALLFTYAGLFLKWSALGTSLGITLWTALSFSLFSSFFLVRPFPPPYTHCVLHQLLHQLNHTSCDQLALIVCARCLQSKLVRDHQELQKRGWQVTLWGTLCGATEMSN